MTPILARPESTSTQAPLADQSRLAVDFVHDLLVQQASDPPPLEQTLAELARAFGVPVAGLAGLRHESVIVKLRVGAADESLSSFRRPWEERPEVLSQIRKFPAAVPTTLS